MKFDLESQSHRTFVSKGHCASTETRLHLRHRNLLHTSSDLSFREDAQIHTDEMFVLYEFVSGLFEIFGFELVSG